MGLAVDARVQVPRPDTEILVEWALEVLASKPTARVVDLGTGSGAVALALKQQMRGLEVWGVDSSAGALTVARSNAEQLGLPVRLVQASWLSPWTSDVNRWDVIVSNPLISATATPTWRGLSMNRSPPWLRAPTDWKTSVRSLPRPPVVFAQAAISC